jgi:large subunit ribosomal protein L28
VKTKRKFYPNLHLKKFFVPELEQWIQLKICNAALRTIDKKGIYQYLKELETKGDINIK